MEGGGVRGSYCDRKSIKFGGVFSNNDVNKQGTKNLAHVWDMKTCSHFTD